ncbi:IS3 family transposase [Burkholderia pyrrocinia]|uniref:IS3 family transposase n=1 Tax=Burkholderia pyrrocinia TaxID=60550 RepID=UPI003BAE69D1
MRPESQARKLLRQSAYPNTVAESFFGSLQKESIKNRICKNRTLSLDEISDHVENFYNSVRPHSYLQGITQSGYEAAIDRN